MCFLVLGGGGEQALFGLVLFFLDSIMGQMLNPFMSKAKVD